MTNKTTKRALLTSVMALLLCFTMLLGTTYAWFTDSVTSAGNKIVAGTLDVDLYMWTAADASVEITNEEDPIFGPGALATANTAETLWEPGKTQVVYFSIKNNGNLALKYMVDLNVTDIVNNLNDVVEYKLTPDAEYGEAPKWHADGLAGTKVVSGINHTQATGTELAPGAEHFFALSVHMLEEAGNEYMNGSITFDMVVFATQFVAEEDSFDNTYDANATFPKNGFGSGALDPQNPSQPITYDVYDREPQDHNAQKVGRVVIPAAALAEGATEASTTIVANPNVYSGVVVNADQGAQTFDVSVSNIKEGNTEDITVEIRVGTGLTGVKLYHKGTEVTNYNYNGEYVIFTATEFSPYTVVYDAVAKDVAADNLDKKVPVADVTYVEELAGADISWTGWGGFNPTAGNAQKLDSVYLFKAPHSNYSQIENNMYKDWYCDYYVKLESNTLSTLPEGSITLGGNYGGYGWVGFDNPTVDTNTWIPLLGSVLGDCQDTGEAFDPYWTYGNVATLVQQFWCGVGVANGNANGEIANLSGAKFVVELRLTNPANTNEYIAVNTVTYDFAGNSTITNYINN